jgi:hypothetical protein
MSERPRYAYGTVRAGFRVRSRQSEPSSPAKAYSLVRSFEYLARRLGPLYDALASGSYLERDQRQKARRPARMAGLRSLALSPVLMIHATRSEHAVATKFSSQPQLSKIRRYGDISEFLLLRLRARCPGPKSSPSFAAFALMACSVRPIAIVTCCAEFPWAISSANRKTSSSVQSVCRVMEIIDSSRPCGVQLGAGGDSRVVRASFAPHLEHFSRAHISDRQPVPRFGGLEPV